MLANWLYGVAYRVAIRARKNRHRRQLRERDDVDMSKFPEALKCTESASSQELCEEVFRLPHQFREPIDLSGDVKVPAAYSLESNKLKICLPNMGKGGGDRPTKLETKNGDGMILLVLERE